MMGRKKGKKKSLQVLVVLKATLKADLMVENSDSLMVA